MNNQALFSLKDKSKKLKCHLLQFFFGALRVNIVFPPLFLSTFSSFFPCTVACRIVFARPEDLDMWPNHLSFHFFSKVGFIILKYFPVAA